MTISLFSNSSILCVLCDLCGPNHPGDNAKHGGNPWGYALITHDKIAQNMTTKGLVDLKVQ
jgi:hypothetical protein